MLYESTTFSEAKEVGRALSATDAIFRYCSFESASLEGGDFDGAFLSCTFRDVELYWGLFNLAMFVACNFEHCTFRGVSFSGCRLVECSFNECRFLADNLGGICTAGETRIYDCSSQNCEGFNEVFPNQVL